jgi:uncharacterized protein YndB with AHSA1/START domain/DNA-binding transcriptional ArsR family regulator
MRSHIIARVETVFRALADPARRELLDRLFARDGQTLTALCGHLPGMTRYGVMKHLRVLEAAGLLTRRRAGRETLHYLNPVPIRLVHDRWIGKFAEPVVATMADLKTRLEGGGMPAPSHVYEVWIRCAPDALWDALTNGDTTERYYYGTRVESEWTAGARVSYSYPGGAVAADGEILACEPPRLLAMTFHPRWDAEDEAAGPFRITWEIIPAGGACRLAATLDDVPAASVESVTGGITLIVSGLKTLLETGEPLTVGAA